MALVGFRRILRYRYNCLFNKRNFKDYPASFLPRKSFQVGDEAKLSKVFSDNDVETFADLTGDRNPLHWDENYAANTRFGRCIVHGVLINGLVSAVLGNVLPGHGCIVLSQQIRFPSPLFIGDTVIASVKVLKFSHSIMVCETICSTVETNKIVLSGEVKLLVPQNK